MKYFFCFQIRNQKMNMDAFVVDKKCYKSDIVDSNQRVDLGLFYFFVVQKMQYLKIDNVEQHFYISISNLNSFFVYYFVKKINEIVQEYLILNSNIFELNISKKIIVSMQNKEFLFQLILKIFDNKYFFLLKLEISNLFYHLMLMLLYIDLDLHNKLKLEVQDHLHETKLLENSLFFLTVHNNYLSYSQSFLFNIKLIFVYFLILFGTKNAGLTFFDFSLGTLSRIYGSEPLVFSIWSLRAGQFRSPNRK
eukprot:TRINITY_DN457_c0_g1_i16.p2 TRINITY_DN457_c0_g1~~TRINITY_DN457_c0_g1_i16.p2  ORF type:complete len:250 (+),score=-0.14 TRINITY_DN457_c0_g1_i16:1823-2572(+)